MRNKILIIRAKEMSLMDNWRVKMSEENKESKPQWKGCIIFGIINIIFVLLCTKLNIVMLSVALILLIAAGVVTTIQSIKEDWKEGFKGSAIGCVVGLL